MLCFTCKVSAQCGDFAERTQITDGIWAAENVSKRAKKKGR